MPLLSIVIANYNYGRFLSEAIESVLSQLDFTPQLQTSNFKLQTSNFKLQTKKVPADFVELIIIDGGSTDNSVDVIKKYAGRLPPGVERGNDGRVERGDGVEGECLNGGVENIKRQTSNLKLQTSNISYWISEPDKGQSDAFNKGFAHAHGKYLTWLNADDLLVSGSLERICKELRTHPECEWFTGNMFRFTDDGEVVECPWGPHYLPKCLQTKHQPLSVYGPATFFTKELFDRVGGMKVYQHFMMDTDLWMRFIVTGVKQRRINCFCWAFRMHADSKTAEYADHKMSFEQFAKCVAEDNKAYRETGYTLSSLNYRLIQLFRIFDGSYFRGLWLKLNFHKVSWKAQAIEV